MNIPRQFLCALSLAAWALVSSQARAAGFERGPDPTAALLNATGPSELGAYKIPAAEAKGFLDDDMRYDAMVKGGVNEGEFSRFVVEGF
jgi:hypothetical protein